MREAPLEEVFDSEIFKSELSRKVEQYAALVLSQKQKPNDITATRVSELEREILDDCSTALLESDNELEVREIIERNFLMYQNGQSGLGYLFDTLDISRIYKELVLTIAKKAKGK